MNPAKRLARPGRTTGVEGRAQLPLERSERGGALCSSSAARGVGALCPRQAPSSKVSQNPRRGELTKFLSRTYEEAPSLFFLTSSAFLRMPFQTELIPIAFFARSSVFRASSRIRIVPS